MDNNEGGDLIVAVEILSVIHDRYDSEHSDPTGTGNTGGDDGDNRDGFSAERW